MGIISDSEYGFTEYRSSLIAKDQNPNVTFKVTTEPTVEPITLTQLKEFARIDGSSEDSLLTSFIKSARVFSESYTNRAFITQTIQLYMDFWYSRTIELPRPPLISITSVQTLDEDDTATSYSSDNYFTVTNSDPGKLIVKNSVSTPYNSTRFYAGYKITYTAGYGSTATYVPDILKNAIKQWATVMYESRNLSSDPPPIVKSMLDPYKVYTL